MYPIWWDRSRSGHCAYACKHQQAPLQVGQDQREEAGGTQNEPGLPPLQPQGQPDPWPCLGWVTAGQHRVTGCSEQASHCSSRKCARVLSIVHRHSDSCSLIYAHVYEHRRFSEIRPKKSVP